MQRTGARRWIGPIMIVWGVVSSCTMLVRSAAAFYALRFLLGIVESGFFPGRDPLSDVLVYQPPSRPDGSGVHERHPAFGRNRRADIRVDYGAHGRDRPVGRVAVALPGRGHTPVDRRSSYLVLSAGQPGAIQMADGRGKGPGDSRAWKRKKRSRRNPAAATTASPTFSATLRSGSCASSTSGSTCAATA